MVGGEERSGCHDNHVPPPRLSGTQEQEQCTKSGLHPEDAMDTERGEQQLALFL